MKTTRFNLVVLTVALLAADAGAEEIATNRLSFSARLGFNISARFKNVETVPAGIPTSPRSTPSQAGRPDGDPYNYDDGYVLTDVSDNYGGQTWYWGYDNRAGQLNSSSLNPGNFNSSFPNNTILLSRATAVTSGSGSSATLDDDPLPGGELTYNRLLGVRGDAHYGLEVAVSFLSLSMRASDTLEGGTTLMTDAYSFTPGTTPPDTETGPYQGSYAGPGFVIGDTPVGSSTVVVPGTVMTDRRQFNAALWGLRLGPYLEVPLGGPMNLSISGGLAVGLLDASASWAQTGGSTTVSGRGDDWDVLWGGYVSAVVTWDLSERWSVAGGAQFQTLGDYEHSFGGRTVEVDLSKSWFVTFGLSYSF